MAKVRCLNCEVRDASRPRQLCWSCFSRYEIRKYYEMNDQYAADAEYAWADEQFPFLFPCQPTNARPGSEAKIRLLMERFASRQQLNHEKDVRIDDEICTSLDATDDFLSDAG